MKKKQTKFATEAFEKAIKKNDKPRYLLKLYVAGTTARSMKAISDIKRLCEEEFSGRYDLDVIDVYQQPGLAREEQIVATPTLLKKLPAPIRKVIGDFTNFENVLVGLELNRK